MKSVRIGIGKEGYEALVGSGALSSFKLGDAYIGRRCAIICDANTRRYAAKLSFAEAPEIITCPPGEQSKSLAQVSSICDQMIAAGLDRRAFVIGVGGGVVGDLSGFVAAIFQRGIPHLQVPTTLLAMVDSSVGGKTGVNTTAGKNLLGAIHQPAMVIADTDTLKTLPQREFRQGFAEIIKHGIIRDASMIETLRENSLSSRAERSAAEGPRGKTYGDATGSLDFARDDLTALIARNIEIKATIVAADERETTGERALLNFGHTVGHAIEHAAGYGRLLHGEALALGMVAACNISIKRAGLSADQRDRVVALLRAFELPTRLPEGISRDQILAGVRVDKKFDQGNVRLVVTPRLGEAHLSSDVTLDDIREAVAEL